VGKIHCPAQFVGVSTVTSPYRERSMQNPEAFTSLSLLACNFSEDLLAMFCELYVAASWRRKSLGNSYMRVTTDVPMASAERMVPYQESEGR
jgi:hypothetical protein